MIPRDWSPVKTLSPRRPSGQDHRNQMSPLHNLTLVQPRFKLLILSGQRRMTLFQHNISPSKYCKAYVKPPSFISSWCKAATLTQFALLKALYKIIIIVNIISYYNYIISTMALVIKIIEFPSDSQIFYYSHSSFVFLMELNCSLKLFSLCLC